MESVYLLLGPENGEKQKKLQQIRSDIKKSVGSDPELYRFYPFDTDDNQIFTALDNNSFFSDHRLVIISQADQLSASQVSTLVTYLNHPSSQSTLVLISEETSLKAPKLLALIPDKNKTIFWELYDNQKNDWVRNYFRGQGITITQDAIETMLELVNNNTQELKTTCAQLAIFWQTEKKSGPIDDEAVDTYVQHTRSEDAFTLFPALAKRDLPASLRIIQTILETGDSGASISTHAGLLWLWRRLYAVSQLRQEGNDEATAFSSATVLGSKTPIRSFRDKNTYRFALKDYSAQEIRDCLAALGEADIALKAGGDMTLIVWEQLCHTIIIDGGKKPEGYSWTITSAF